ncbi:hypothetical protein LTR65_007782 [Meristemomyces frigidus]
MRRQQDNEHYERQVGSGIQTVPLGEVWSAFTSALGEQSAAILSTPTAGEGASTTPALVTMTTTAQVTVPVSTVTVESTVLKTSFVTVHLTTGLVEQSTSVLTSVSTSASRSYSAILSSSSETPLASETRSLRLTTSSQHTTLQVLATKSSQTQSLSTTISVQSQEPSATPSLTPSAADQASHSSQKHVIAGGVVGAIAGFVLIAVLLCFFFRRRRRKEADNQGEDNSINEKGIRPAIVRQWTALTGKGTPKPTPQIPQSSSPVTVDEDHHIIRMSLNHWARPFAQGQGEGFRDSVAPGQLRVVNPDLSRPTTPRLSSDTAGSFLKRQRGALAAVLLSTGRSRASSRTNIHQAGGLPEITIDPILSRECIPSTARTPSFKSYQHSVTTLPHVQHQPLDDPFLTPSDERAEPAAQQRPKRPSLAPLQGAAGAASRTISHIGSFLNPFRTQSNVAESVRTFSRHSVSTLSLRSSRRNTGFSDPFDLDKPSVRGSAVPGRSASDLERGQTPNWTVYEGT